MNPNAWLKRYGYLPGVDVKNLHLLDQQSRDFKPAMEKLQAFWDDDIGLTDGILGDRSIHAMTAPRCDHPDFPDPNLASLADSDDQTMRLVAGELEVDPELARCICASHARMAAAVGQGSWPMPCRREGITVSIDDSAKPSSIDLDRLWAEAVITWGLVGIKLVRVPKGERANIRISWVRGRGWIGLAEFNNQSCNDSVFNQLSYNYAPNFFQVLGLLLHELGHNMNLQHTRGGLMNPTIIRFDEPFRFTEADPSYRTVMRYTGGEPIPGPKPPDPKPPTDVGVEIKGDLQVYVNGKPVGGPVIVVPKPLA